MSALSQSTSKVPFLHEKRIEEEAGLLLKEWGERTGGAVTPPVPIDDIIELRLGLTYELDDLRARFGHDDVLGAIWFDAKLIRVDRSLVPEDHARMLGRYRFTLAHEAGHWRLHRPYFTKDPSQEQLFGAEGPPAFVCRSSLRPPEEIQADKFAAALLMPKDMVRRAWEVWRGDQKHVCVLDLDVPDMDSDHVRNESIALERFCKPLADRFEVSSEAMRIRLEAMELLVRERLNLLFS